MSLIPIASSSRANATAVVSPSGSVVIVDAGGSRAGILGRLAEAGVLHSGKQSPDALLLTHEHGDHASYVHQWERYSAPIFATAGAARTLKINTSDLWRPVRAGKTACVAPGMAATAISVSHDAAEPVAWRIAFAGGAVVIATDLGEIPDGFAAFCSGATEILMEANHHLRLLELCDYPDMLKRRIRGREGHLDIETVAEWIRTSLPDSVERLWLGHISHKCCDPSIVRAHAAKALGQRAVRLEVIEP